MDPQNSRGTMTSALQSAKAAIERIILNPANHDLLAVVKAARNGAVYGAKVRFPHALVMVFLFRSGSFRQKADLVFRATRTHARNLAKFATIYKLMCYALKHYGPTPGKEGECLSFLYSCSRRGYTIHAYIHISTSRANAPRHG